jgi:hypothetical protein
MADKDSACAEKGEVDCSREVLQKPTVAAGDYRIESWPQQTAPPESEIARFNSRKEWPALIHQTAFRPASIQLSSFDDSFVIAMTRL